MRSCCSASTSAHNGWLRSTTSTGSRGYGWLCRAVPADRRAGLPARGPRRRRTIRPARTVLLSFLVAMATARGRPVLPACCGGSGSRPGSRRGTCRLVLVVVVHAGSFWSQADNVVIIVCTVAESVNLITQADRDGLDLFTVADHPYFGAKLDAYALVSFLLGQTERIASACVNGHQPAPAVPRPCWRARSRRCLHALSGGGLLPGQPPSPRRHRLPGRPASRLVCLSPCRNSGQVA